VPCRERRRRRAKLERRRSRQRRRRQGEQLSGSNSGSDSASDAAAAGEDDGEGHIDGEAGAIVLAGQSRKKKATRRGSSSRSKRRSRQGDEAADGAEGGSSGSASDSEGSDDETAEAHEQRRAAAAAAIGGRTLPKIMFQLAPEDRPEAGAAAGGTGSDSWASEGDAVRGRSRSRADSRRQGGVTTDGDGGVTGADSDGGAVAVPERIAQRIAQKRHRWTPQQDRQLLRWVVAQRVELGTRGQVSCAGDSSSLCDMLCL
jgi:hypothetical protein